MLYSFFSSNTLYNISSFAIFGAICASQHCNIKIEKTAEPLNFDTVAFRWARAKMPTRLCVHKLTFYTWYSRLQYIYIYTRGRYHNIIYTYIIIM